MALTLAKASAALSGKSALLAEATYCPETLALMVTLSGLKPGSTTIHGPSAAEVSQALA